MTPPGTARVNERNPVAAAAALRAVLLCVEGWLVEGARCEVACAWVAAVNVGASGAV